MLALTTLRPVLLVRADTRQTACVQQWSDSSTINFEPSICANGPGGALRAGSHLTRETDNLSSTQFATHDAQDHASLPLISWHAKPGDVIAFAGETVSDNRARPCWHLAAIPPQPHA